MSKKYYSVPVITVRHVLASSQAHANRLALRITARQGIVTRLLTEAELEALRQTKEAS